MADQPLSLHHMKRIIRVILLLLCSIASCQGWDWADLFQMSTAGKELPARSPPTLTLQEVSEMRVRDIKRRLTRTHGYDADEIARMLDKKELIHALAFEEHKLDQTNQVAFQRELFWKAAMATAIAGVLVLFWPLIRHALEVAHVNFVVFTDRKKLEAMRCWELRSYAGCLGVAVMFVLDILQIWLTASVILSWITTSKYFFPIPSLPVRPAAMMSGPVSSGPLARYGINVGPMVVTWTLRFLQGRLERWTGRAMANAQRAQQKQQRANETAEEKAARKARKAAKRAAREQATRHQQQPDASPEAFGEFTAHETSNDTPKTTVEERRQAMADAAEHRRQEESPVATEEVIFSKLDELD